MLTYVKLKNFMSFKEVTFDFKNNKKDYKKFISIYGENGSGKSNFVTSIDFLCRTVKSMDMGNDLTEIREKLFGDGKKLPDDFVEMILSSFDISKIMEDCRMIECEDPTYVEYGFMLNGHEGYYVLEFGSRFQKEVLYYFTGKQRGELYSINNVNNSINMKFSNKLFTSSKVEDDFKNEIKKYWGKHTLLSVLQKERNEKNELYIYEGVLKYAIDVVDMFKDISVFCKKPNGSRSGICCAKPYNILEDLAEGKVEEKNIFILDKTESILSDFFSQSYADIKNVYYKKSKINNEVQYRLIIQKMIGGELRNINFKNESAGTRQVLEIIRSILGAFCGVTVIYDEIDDGIHDLLLKCIIESMKDEITGQLIITTHNTLLLESIDVKSAYIINVDYMGNKNVKCLDQYPRIQGSNNPRLMYLKGLFGGVPFCEYIDFSEIINSLDDNKDTGGGED